jgi:uncharacterized protein YjbI with pentapeptide repeats
MQKQWAWKAVDVDHTTRNGFQWPFTGTVKATGPFTHGDPCPRSEGDGLCLAKTFAGASQRGKPTQLVLLVSYLQKDLLGEDEAKLRVKQCRVERLENWIHDSWKLITKYGNSADLSSADLRFANLNAANLRFANLNSAILSSADLSSTDLRFANLKSANLRFANLYSADLNAADLNSANLNSADLRFANLRSANLSSANLYSANLRSANLSSANLYSADLYLADLRSANLKSANLSSAILRSANLSSADLRSAVGLTQDQVNSAYGDKYTRLPAGLVKPRHWN